MFPMSRFFFPACLSLLLSTSLAFAADPAPAPKDAPAEKPAEKTDAAKTDSTAKPASAPAAAPAPASAKADSSPVLVAPQVAPPAATPIATKQTPTVLPQVEVRKARITEIDREIAKQEEAIAREKKATHATEADKALNNPEVTKAVSIFGGQSSELRANQAKERVNLMESEKDLLEAMKLAKTKAEREELQKAIDDMRAMRRELEKAERTAK